VFALGADHVFVAVDKWKNCRKDFPNASCEDIAAKALPDSAVAMLLTTSTTAIAFFGTAICPVAPVKLFSIFCGLLITWDYILDILLIFPCLCIYDNYTADPNARPNWCITCHCCAATEGGRDEISDDSEIIASHEERNEHVRNSDVEEAPSGGTAKETEESALANENHADKGHLPHLSDLHLHIHDTYKDVDADHKPSFIRRLLLGYYHGMHYLRYPLLAGCVAAFAICAYVAAGLSLPLTSDVRLLRADHEYELVYEWRTHLFSSEMMKDGGSYAQVIWGVIPGKFCAALKGLPV